MNSNFNKIDISKIFMIIFLILYSVLFLLGLFDNPLSDKNISIITTKSIYKEELDNKKFWNKQSDGQYIRSRRQYLTQNNQHIVFIKNKDKTNDTCTQIGYLNKQNNDIGSTDCIDLETIKNPYVHPMDILSKTENGYHILGTISDGDGSVGIDRLSKLSEGIFRTALFSILSLMTFLFFGIYFALSIGYFNNASIFLNFLSKINNLILKSFQCVPILLWMLITMILVAFSDIPIHWRYPIYYLFFGLFSSPALSNLIVEKINQMKKQDFIVALKLLGISNKRIIIYHMLKYYCLPIITFQTAYIMAHAFFLDLTLCYIQESSSHNMTLGYYIQNSFRSPNYYDDKFYLLIISFILTSTFFYWSNYYKKKI